MTAVLGNWIGALTLTGSFVAFGKLHGIMDSSAMALPGKNLLNMAMVAASVYASEGAWQNRREACVGAVGVCSSTWTC